MEIKYLQASGFEAAFRGMRNPLNSWKKSDSTFGLGDQDLVYEIAADMVAHSESTISETDSVINSLVYDGITQNSKTLTEYALLGQNDLKLAQRLISAGPEHAKFLRQINVSFDLTAPLFFFKEFDTYKIGTTANSTSTMHKILSTPITREMFEIDDYNENLTTGNGFIKDSIEDFLSFLESLRLHSIALLEQSKQIDLTEAERKILAMESKKYWKELIRWLPEGLLQTRTVTMNYAVLRNIIKQRKNHKLTEWHTFINAMHALPYAKELIFYEL